MRIGTYACICTDMCACAGMCMDMCAGMCTVRACVSRQDVQRNSRILPDMCTDMYIGVLDMCGDIRARKYLRVVAFFTSSCVFTLKLCPEIQEI